MKMLNFNRMIVAVLGIPLVVFIYLSANKNIFPLLVFLNVITGLALYEYYEMLTKAGKKVYASFGLVAGLIIPNLTALNIVYGYNFTKFDFLTLVVFALLIYRVLTNQIENSLEIISNTVLGIIYVSVFLSYFLDICAITERPGEIILIIQIIIWACDVFAGLIGVSIGRKFFKRGFTEISPKKSIEGSIGGLVCGALALVIIILIRDGFEKIDASLFVSLALAFLISVVAEIGDLVESLFKRECKIKDSGTILLGHGGVLDRFDSTILVMPFAYFIIKILGSKYF